MDEGIILIEMLFYRTSNRLGKPGEKSGHFYTFQKVGSRAPRHHLAPAAEEYSLVASYDLLGGLLVYFTPNEVRGTARSRKERWDSW